MKIIYRYLFVCSTFFCFIPLVKGQDSSKNNADKSYFEAGLSYLSNNVYLGRHDSLRVPYFTPTLSYYNKSGFYAIGSLSYLNSTDVSRIDLFSILAGYMFKVNKFTFDFSGEKDFYNSQSQNVKSEIQGSVNGIVAYDFGFIKPLLAGGIVFNTKNDYYGAFGLGHSFYLINDDLEISPSFLINASTQNYYNSYYSMRKFKPRRKKRPGAVITTNAYLQDASHFKIMDSEFSLPLFYSIGRFVLNITPTYSVPENPNTVVTIITPPSGIDVTRTKTEKLSSIFYWTAGITYSF